MVITFHNYILIVYYKQIHAALVSNKKTKINFTLFWTVVYRTLHKIRRWGDFQNYTKVKQAAGFHKRPNSPLQDHKHRYPVNVEPASLI